jgi:hypothetical protein
MTLVRSHGAVAHKAVSHSDILRDQRLRHDERTAQDRLSIPSVEHPAPHRSRQHRLQDHVVAVVFRRPIRVYIVVSATSHSQPSPLYGFVPRRHRGTKNHTFATSNFAYNACYNHEKHNRRNGSLTEPSQEISLDNLAFVFLPLHRPQLIHFPRVDSARFLAPDVLGSAVAPAQQDRSSADTRRHRLVHPARFGHKANKGRCLVARGFPQRGYALPLPHPHGSKVAASESRCRGNASLVLGNHRYRRQPMAMTASITVSPTRIGNSHSCTSILLPITRSFVPSIKRASDASCTFSD